MKLERIIRKITAEPWLITRAGHATIVQLIESKLGESIEGFSQPGEPSAARPAKDLFGDPIEQMEFDPRSRTATIPIKGVIGAGLGRFEKACGACDTMDVAEDMDNAAMAGAKRIILNIDSPGGTVGGVPELAEKISSMQKDGLAVFSFTSGLMASAAYWIGSSAMGGIYATASAEIGSIGVYQPFIDQGRRFSAMGYNVELFKSGKYKGMGYPGTSLTDEQRALLQAQVNDIYGKFTAHVLRHRSRVPGEAMQGQTFMADKAQKNALIDGITTDLKSLRDKISKS